MKVENEYREDEVIVPTAETEAQAVKIFENYYAVLGCFQVQVTQLDHMFFEPKLYDLYFDKFEKVEGRLHKKKVRHYFYSVENLVRLKRYGEIYIDMQLKANENDNSKSAEEKEIFAKTFKKYKDRLSKAFENKLTYLNNLMLLSKLEKVEHRKLVRPVGVVHLLEQFKIAVPDDYAKLEAKVNEDFALKVKCENQIVEDNLVEKTIDVGNN